MPQLEVTTKSANSVWKSPDGQREIFEVMLDFKGQDFKAKTYSKDISVPGWTGTVESYEKDGRNGSSETFVKQPPKEGGFTPQQGGSPSRASGQGGSKAFSSDPFTMYLSYAKDVAVAMIAKSGGVDKEVYMNALALVMAGGTTLYEGRPEAAGTVQKPAEPAQAESASEQTSAAEPTVAELNAVLGGELFEPKDGEDTPPWITPKS